MNSVQNFLDKPSPFLFGWLLGPTGALLSMPITVTIMLITQQDERTRWIAQFMGSGEE